MSKIKNKKIIVTFLCLVVISIFILTKKTIQNSYYLSIDLAFIKFENHEKEVIQSPPFFNEKKLIYTAKSFRNRKKSSSFINWFFSHFGSVTYTSLNPEWVYAFEVNVDNIEYWILMNKKAEILYENQNPNGADEIRTFLLHMKGEKWFREIFPNYNH